MSKLNPGGSTLVYSTFLGGSTDEGGWGVAVDVASNAYVTGWNYSADFPTTLGAFQRMLRGGQAAFVSKLNPTGTALVYSTLLSGGGSAIAVDAAGNAYITGYTYVTGSTGSADFPTTPGAFQPTFRGAVVQAPRNSF